MSLQPPPARTGVVHLPGLGWWERLHRAGALEMEAILPANPTKSATILKLLGRPKGASIAQLQKVTVTEDGFEYGGIFYRSLTKVARVITGANWSGPRFFGLNGTMARSTPNDPRDD